jgi:hypothetical protein
VHGRAGEMEYRDKRPPILWPERPVCWRKQATLRGGVRFQADRLRPDTVIPGNDD